MKVVVGSDHAGYQLKMAMGEFLRSLGHEVLDVGAYDEKASDYPDFADKVGRAVLDGKSERGVLICGSGVGASVAANKLPGIRAGMCHDTYSAHQGVEHDDINVLVLGSRVIGVALAQDLVKAFLGAKFTHEERHVRRLGKVKAMEDKFCDSRAIQAESRESSGLPRTAQRRNAAYNRDFGILQQRRTFMTTTTTVPNVGATQGMNPLKALLAYGQSPWMDYIRRDLLTSGGLKKMIDEDGLRGMTSNPTIFEKAITGSKFYADILESPDAKATGRRAACTRKSRFATCRTPRTFSSRSMRKPSVAMAT